MRPLLLAFILALSLKATELIYISNDSSHSSLQALELKYQQPLLINNKKVYLIPSACRLERYFGGASQGKLVLTTKPQLTQEIVVTQEVFEAKDESVITQKIEVEKSIALVEGKVSKAFLDDKEGRGFGGASEVPLNFNFQKIEATQKYMKPTSEKEKIITEPMPIAEQKPQCQLLDDGSGYSLIHTNEAQLYFQAQFSSIRNGAILFQ